MHLQNQQKQDDKKKSSANNSFENHHSITGFVDNRPGAVAQRRLQELADNSLQVKQFKVYQTMVDNSPHFRQQNEYQSMADDSPQVKQMKAYQEMAAKQYVSNTSFRINEPDEKAVQGKFEPIQQGENKTGLPGNLKSGIENLSGHSLDDVKVHYNSVRPAELDAHAYAQGTDIHVGPGQEKHLPHEAWHVVQQKQGRVKPTVQVKGEKINDDQGLEKEADVMGGHAVDLIQKKSGSIPGKDLNTVSGETTEVKSTDNSRPLQMSHWEKGRLVTDEEENYRLMYDKFMNTYRFIQKALAGEYEAPADGKKKIPDPNWNNLFDQLDQAVSQACGGGMMITQNFHLFNPGTPLATLFAQVEAAGTGGSGGLLEPGSQGPGNIPLAEHPDEVQVDGFIARAQNAYAAWTGNPTMAARGPNDTVRLNVEHVNILRKRSQGARLPAGWTLHPSLSGAWALHHPGPNNAAIDARTGNPATFIYHVVV